MPCILFLSFPPHSVGHHGSTMPWADYGLNPFIIFHFSEFSVFSNERNGLHTRTPGPMQSLWGKTLSNQIKDWLQTHLNCLKQKSSVNYRYNNVSWNLKVRSRIKPQEGLHISPWEAKNHGSSLHLLLQRVLLPHLLAQPLSFQLEALNLNVLLLHLSLAKSITKVTRTECRIKMTCLPDYR